MSHLDDEKDVKNLEGDQVETLEHGGGRRVSVIAENYNEFIGDAQDAVHGQKEQSITEALKQYKKGVIYSIIFSAAIIMEGYDTLLLGQFFANQAFARRFGEPDPGNPGTYQIPAQWQTGLSCSTQVGQILGLQITGFASERFGYRPTMLVALVCLTGFLFIQFFATSLPMLLAGYILLGFPWGTFQTMTVSYAAEVMPVQIRPFLTTYVNLCWVIGQIICSGVNRALINDTTDLAYKIPFAIQWIWPIPIFIGIFLAPESPWWLTRKGRFEDAERSINKLTSGVGPDFAKKQVAMMHHTNELEKSAEVGSSYWDCFKGVNLRRTEIACIVWLIQTTCGSPLMGNGTYYLQQAGLASDTASTLNLIMFVIGGVGTVSSWFLMKPFGRRSIYIVGQCILASIMLLTAVLGTINGNNSTRLATGALLIIFTFVYDISVGPVCYSLVAEIGSTRLRSKTVVLARNLYNVGGLVVGFLNPYMLNPTAWNWGPKSGYLWCGTCCLGIIWSYFRLPEPKGRTYGELDILFEDRVPARKFKTTKVDEFAAAERTAAAGVGGGFAH